MRKLKRPSRGPAKSENLALFADLPEPPDAAKLVEYRNPKHPIWTEHKARLIARYLEMFVYVTKSGTYIDGFAGRQTGKTDKGWAAELVLANSPRRLRRFYLCDSDPEQVAALEQVRDRQPPKTSRDSKRDIEVIPGDFNNMVSTILATRRIDPACFCLLDQRTFECQWSTVEALASFRSEKKIELFYFLPIGWLDRAILATTKNTKAIDLWWGRDDWEFLVDLKHYEIALAFRERFLELGYKHCLPFPILDREAGDRIMFYMILATDHDEAPKLMYRAYNQATVEPDEWEQLKIDLFARV